MQPLRTPKDIKCNTIYVILQEKIADWKNVARNSQKRMIYYKRLQEIAVITVFFTNQCIHNFLIATEESVVATYSMIIFTANSIIKQIHTL